LEVDLGEFVAGQQTRAVAEFAVSNKGTGVLQLRELIRTCECADVIPSATRLATGETATVQLQVKLGDSIGKKSAALDIVTSDPVRPAVRVTTIWGIVAPVKMYPESFDVGEFGSGDSGEATITLFARDSENASRVRISSATTDSPFVTISVEDIDESLRGDGGDPERPICRVRARVDAHSPIHVQSASARLAIEGIEDSAICVSVPITWKRVSKFRAVPPSLFLGYRAPGEEVRRKIELIDPHDVPVPIEQAEVDRRELTWERMEPAGQESATCALIRFVAPAEHGVYRGNVRLRPAGATDSRNDVIVPVMAYVQNDSSGGNTDEEKP
jgi:hypothetical protein